MTTIGSRGGWRLVLWLGLGLATAGAARPAAAQTIGTFSWQLQPFCNVVTVTVVQQGASYTLDGRDDQCGTTERATATGIATLNQDGTIAFGLTIVPSSAVTPLALQARISLATLGGTWQDSDGNAGTFAFNQAAAGSPRPSVPRMFDLGVVNLATAASVNLPIDAPYAAFRDAPWTAVLEFEVVPGTFNVYPLPGPGVTGVSTYRASIQSVGTTSSRLQLSRSSGAGETYRVRVFRGR
jgi:hypothetical protein